MFFIFIAPDGKIKIYLYYDYIIIYKHILMFKIQIHYDLYIYNIIVVVANTNIKIPVL